LTACGQLFSPTPPADASAMVKQGVSFIQASGKGMGMGMGMDKGLAEISNNQDLIEPKSLYCEKLQDAAVCGGVCQ
jgi:hypothetical protein